VQRPDCIFGGGGDGEDDEPAALGAAGRLHHDVGVHNLARSLEVVLEMLPGHRVGKVAHIDRPPLLSAYKRVGIDCAALH